MIIYTIFETYRYLQKTAFISLLQKLGEFEKVRRDVKGNLIILQ